MNGLAATTKSKHSKEIKWIDIFNRHDGLIINFPDGGTTKVENRNEAKTIIRTWVRDSHGAHGVRVMWPESHKVIWAVDL